MPAQSGRLHRSPTRHNGPAVEPTPQQLKQEGHLPLRSADVLIATSLVVVSALAVVLMPEGSILRLIVVLPTLFFAPGYLLIQALQIPVVRRWSRVAHAVAAIGISPGVVGLLALSTALIPGGFRPTAIVGVITFSSIALAALSIYRRSAPVPPAGTPRSFA